MKTGDKVRVKDKEDSDWDIFDGEGVHIYLGYYNEQHWAIDQQDGCSYAWDEVRTVPTKHYTPKTWPKGPILLRNKVWGKDSWVVVQGVNANSYEVEVSSGTITFNDLYTEFEMSLDNGITWKSCEDNK